MNKLEEFLKKEEDSMEARQYRYREREIDEINAIYREMKAEKLKKKEDFKEQLRRLGVNIVERRKEK